MQSAAVLAGRHGLSPSSNVAAPPAVGVEEGQDLSWLHQAAEEASRAALAAGEECRLILCGDNGEEGT
eukprot:scaffold305472_cov23-Tisochrysis_lutea.AAC.1